MKNMLRFVIAIVLAVISSLHQGPVSSVYADTVPLSANENRGREVSFGGKQWIIIEPMYKHIMLKENDGNRVRTGIESYLHSQFFNGLGEDKNLVDVNGIRVPLQSYVFDFFNTGNGTYPQRNVSWWIDFWADGIPAYVDQNGNLGGAEDPNETHAVFPVATLIDGVFVESGGRIKAVSVPSFSPCTLAGNDLATATITCTIDSDGGDPVSERGIVYAPAPYANPTLLNRYFVSGAGTGQFTVPLNSLDKHAIYHLRAYAKNVAGTAYSANIEFASGVDPDKTHIYVTPTGNDINGCGQVGDEYATIGKALEDVDDNGTVHISAGTYQENLTISKSVNVTGAGKDNTFIDGGNSGRVLYLEENITVSIENIAIRNGKAADGLDYTASDGPTNGEPGGGIYNKAALTLTDCLIAGNSAGKGGKSELWAADGLDGGAGGGIFNDGYLTVENSIISSNQSGRGGEGFGSDVAYEGAAGPGGDGGGIYNNHSLIVQNCTLLNNYARPGGPGVIEDGEDGSGGGIYNNGTMSITNSSIWSNSCDGMGKNIYNAGDQESAESDNNWWGSNNGPYAEINSIYNLLVQKWIVMAAAAADEKIPAGGSTSVLAEFETNNFSEQTTFDLDDIKVDFTASNGSITSPVYTTDGDAAAVYTADTTPGSITIEVKAGYEKIAVNVQVDTFVVSEDLPTCVRNIPYSAKFNCSGGSQPYTWSASGLPDGLILDSLSGEISGSPLQDGDYDISIAVMDADGKSADFNYHLSVKLGSGNGGYLVTPVVSETYFAESENMVSMIVNDDVTGFRFFMVEIKPVLGHEGNEVAVFTHNRNGVQIGIAAVAADFENINTANAGFNVQPGDVVKVFIVDKLPVDANSNPSML